MTILEKILFRIRGNISTESLLKRGMVAGKNFKRMNDVWIDPGHCWLIRFGDNVTLAPRVTILAHDASLQHALHTTKVGRVDIGNDVFIGACSTILPGVTIGDHCVIGAGSLVCKDIPANSVAVGNPAHVIQSYDEYIYKNIKQMETSPCFDTEYLFPKISEKCKAEMVHTLINRKGFLI